MKLKAFCVFDVKANVFNPPFFMGQTGEAVRAFKDLANDPNTTVGRHPEDYVLKYIGFFDNESGVLQMEEHQALGVASEYQSLKETPVGVRNLRDASKIS